MSKRKELREKAEVFSPNFRSLNDPFREGSGRVTVSLTGGEVVGDFGSLGRQV